MRLVLTTDGVLRHSQLTFVSHSMSGLVTRAFLLKYRTVVPRIRLLYFFATPTTGSPYARLAALFSQNSQLKQLYPLQSDNYLGTLQSDWLAAHFGIKSYCAYETQPLYRQIIVERQSATSLCTERLDPIDADHITIVKPRDSTSTPYRALQAAFVETAVAAKPIGRERPRNSKAISSAQAVQASRSPRSKPRLVIAAHYPSGELFAVEPKTGALRLVSARLGNISGIAIRPNREIVVLDNQIERKFILLVGVDPETGSHRDIGAYLGQSTAQQALALETADSAVVVLDGTLIRVDLKSGQTATIVSSELLRNASGVTRMPSGDILVTVIPDRIVRVNPTDGSSTVISTGGRLWHPRAPTPESSHTILVGTAAGNGGKLAGVLRLDIKTGAQEFVATGPFVTVAGLAIESDGSILVADNGRGAPGDEFLARVDPITGRTKVLISAQTSNWKFLNGRSIAVSP